MAKKRKRGLAGTPAQHRTQAEHYYQHAVRLEKDARNGGLSCRGALKTIAQARVEAAKANSAAGWITGDWSRVPFHKPGRPRPSYGVRQGKDQLQTAIHKTLERIEDLFDTVVNRCGRTAQEFYADKSLSGAKRRRKR